MSTCPLCKSSGTHRYHLDNRREYWRCRLCELIHVPAPFHLSSADEKAQYDLHQNDPADTEYRRFLSSLAAPLLERIKPGSCGLDFGSGPGPALSAMLQEAGHGVDLFDVFYAPDMSVWERAYDFISATEVFEHLSNPAAELARLRSCLKSGGWLAVMTQRAKGIESFRNWHYKLDPTHICFWSETSFDWVAQAFNFEAPQFVAPNVVFLQAK